MKPIYIAEHSSDHLIPRYKPYIRVDYRMDVIYLNFRCWENTLASITDVVLAYPSCFAIDLLSYKSLVKRLILRRIALRC